MSLNQALQFTLGPSVEGGYSDNPHDHGGATDHGITQATYNTYRALKRLPAQDVRNITTDEVSDCYTLLYWNPSHCDDMSTQLGICVFDWAVNHGVHGATETLQDMLGIAADGIYGPVTKHALENQDHDELWRHYNDARRAWYREYATNNPDQRVFLAGWLNRVDELDAYVEGL